MKRPDIHFSIVHGKEKDEIKELVIRELSRKNLPIKTGIEWNGDRMIIRGKGFDAIVDVNEDELEIEINLSLLLRPFSKKIEEELKRDLGSKIVQ